MMFLHDLGSLQYFENQFLKSKVVIDPQWIVDVMACVVSVHDTPIQVINHSYCSLFNISNFCLNVTIDHL